MEDILFELRDYIVGLNAGRWDYLFSMIKSLAGTRYEMTFPDRGKLTMEVPFMRRYAEKIVAVCERRRAYPMGGMSALIPQRKDAEKNERALASVRADKEREARQGFKGTWVAHPDLVPIARDAFQNAKRDENSRGRESRYADLLPRASEEPFINHQPTLAGVMLNIDVALRYISHWIGGLGAVAIHGLMEDAATAEISRAQLWQWRKNAVSLETGDRVTSEWLAEKIRATTIALLNSKEESLSIAESDLKTAETILLELIEQPAFTPFLTLPAMDRLKSNVATNAPETLKGNIHVDSRI
jgi:malate synthase